MKDTAPMTFPPVMGYNMSGLAVEVGIDARNIMVDDAVFARPNQDDVCAIAELTAWQALITRGHLKARDKVLVHAGSGGVLTIAIQTAKHVGASIATTCSARHVDPVKRLGADVVIDYNTEAFYENRSDYASVFDTLGDDTTKRSFKVLKKRGAMISINGQDT